MTYSHSASVYRQLAHSPATIAAYASDLRSFREAGGTIPCPPNALATYLARQARLLKPSTLRRQLAAIAFEHVRRGLRSPTRAPVVQQTMRGIRRAGGAPIRQAKPVTPAILRAITRRFRELSSTRNARDRALLLLGFAGGFRRSELAQLRIGDIVFTRSGLVARLRRSKTDPYGRGRDVPIPYARETSLCPVRALRQWLFIVRASFGVDDDLPLFARIDRYGVLHPGLAAGSVGALLRERLQHAGLDHAGYSAHSLRAGLVTSAARAGTPLWAIQRQTGHRSISSVHRYIRDIPMFVGNPVRLLL